MNFEQSGMTTVRMRQNKMTPFRTRTIGRPILPFDDAMDAMSGLQLLAQGRDVVIRKNCCIEGVLPFPWRKSGMSTKTGQRCVVD